MAFWDRISARGNVEDRRGLAPVVGGIGVGGLALLFVINTLLGGDPLDFLSQIQDVPIRSQQNLSSGDFEGQDEYEVFASTVLGSNNEMWGGAFGSEGKEYSPPKLVLFRTSTESQCGVASSEVGPHYCPLDETIYLDETFFEELTDLLGAKGGDVAEAYVIAHEAAHHAQNQLGIMDRLSRERRLSPQSTNDLSIKLELQADCFAGLWANSIKELGVFQPGEIDEAIDTAKSVGDDRVQQRTTGQVSPENWTHGSSAQRVEWFNKGFEKGELHSCDTFASQ